MKRFKRKLSVLTLSLFIFCTHVTCMGTTAEGNGVSVRGNQSVPVIFNGDTPITDFENPGMANDALPKEKPRLIVKLDEKLAAQIESVLPQTNVLNGNDLNKLPVLSKYKFKEVKPLYRSISSWKKKTRSSETAFVDNIKNKFPKRTRRSNENAPINNFSGTYIIEPDVASDEELENLISSIKNEPGVISVEVDKTVHVQMTPNDPDLTMCYGLKNISAYNAWDITMGEGITVAVIDSGIDKGHYDIDDSIWININEIPGNGIDDDGNGYIDDTWGWDFINSDNDPQDDNGHGTHVAGIIAAEIDNNCAIAGVAPKSRVMSVKAFDDTGGGEESGIIDAIIYATNNGADVLNLSFGTTGKCTTALEDAINYAHSLGVVIVAAAGNEMMDVINFYPAQLSNVITVSASDFGDNAPYYTNYGNKLDVSAPGSGITSLAASLGKFSEHHDVAVGASGTSMAAPFVSGLAALILSCNPQFSNEEVRQVIRSTADDDTELGFFYTQGYGRINAFKAVSAKSVLEARILSPRYKEMVTGKVPISGNAKGRDFEKYVLEYGEGNRPSEWNIIEESSLPADNSLLGTFDTTVVPDGVYTLRLRVFDNNSPQTVYEDRIEVKVDYVSISNPGQPTVPSLSNLFISGAEIPIYGTATGPSMADFKLEWTELEDPMKGSSEEGWSTSGFVMENDGTSDVADGLLGTWDSSVFPDRSGYCQIRLSVENEGFISEAYTMIYIEKDLLSANWPQNLKHPTRSCALPAKGLDGKTDFVASYPDRTNIPEAGFNRYSYDGISEHSSAYTRGFISRAAVSDIGGLEGDETFIIKDNLINIVKPDNSFVELPYTAPPGVKIKFNMSSIIVEDVNGDGNKDIVSLGDRVKQTPDSDEDITKQYLFAWNTEGTPLSNNFPIVVNRFEEIFTNAFLVVDLDNCGKKEFLVIDKDTASNKTSIKVFNWDGTPTGLSYQSNAESTKIEKLQAGDLNKDGQVEIAFVAYENYGPNIPEDKIYMLDHNMSVIQGWPVSVDSTLPVHFSGIADMDRDSKDEIIVYNHNGIYILKADGSIMSNAWPYKGNGLGNCAIGDVNGDGYPELVMCKYEGKLIDFDYTNYNGLTIDEIQPSDTKRGSQKYSPESPYYDKRLYCSLKLIVVDHNANVIKSWNVMGKDGKQPHSLFAPVLGDFNDDGEVEVSLTYDLISRVSTLMNIVTDTGIIVYKMNAPYDPENMDWPMEMHDTQNSSVKISDTTQTGTVTIKGYIKPDFEIMNQDKILSNFKVGVIGTDYTAITDENGCFEIKVPKNSQPYTLKISKKNYLSREIPNIITNIQGAQNITISTLDNPTEIWAGDMEINEEQDNSINIRDIMTVATAFNSIKGDERYNENLDLNNDGAANIVDIMIVAKHFNTDSSDYPLYSNN